MSRAVVIAGIITLALTALRLYGELEGWDPQHFNREAGGKGALVGISWLMPIFGLWFGARLARNGLAPAHKGRAIALPLIGFLLMAGIFALQFNVLKLEGDAARALFWVTGPLCALFAVFAWPALAGANLGYGLLARLPIVAITYWAVSQGWDVHHVKLPPGSKVAEADRAFVLSMAQLTMWIPFTILIGGFFGGIAAALTRKK
jgi:hypothetical protein